MKPHWPALDGLRGIAVLGILFFHAGHLVGGWLGVDLFFVLSGFLITSLLLAEYETTSQISLGRFWLRRARRLLPALILTLLGVIVYAAVFSKPEELERVRADVLATLFYAANWNMIFGGQEYWEMFSAPSPLDHSWSLAIEEQFYLLWPPIAWFVLRASMGSRRALTLVASVLALASAGWMAWLFDPDMGTSRVYYGTDTRVAAPLVGAVLAGLLRGRLSSQRASDRLWGDLLALSGVILLGFAWISQNGQDTWIYRGGLLSLEIVAAGIMAGVLLSPNGLVARIFSLKPLRALGLVSYGVYLWHWPIYLVLSPQRTGLEDLPLTVIRLALTLGVAALSYRFVEQPIRRGQLQPRTEISLALVSGAAVIGMIFAVTTRVAEPDSNSTTERVPFLGAALDLPLPQVVPGKTQILLVGDSLAHGLGPEFKKETDLRGIHAEALGYMACGPMHADRVRNLGHFQVDLTDCQELSKRWTHWITEYRPHHVLLLEGWPGEGEKRIDGAWLHPCDPLFDRAYHNDLRQTVLNWKEAGSRPVLATNPPAFFDDISIQLSAIAEGRVDDLERFLIERTECQNRVRRAVARETDVQLIDLEEWVCPRGVCSREMDGVLLRGDGMHFRGEGARRASQWLLDQIPVSPTPPENTNAAKMPGSPIDPPP